MADEPTPVETPQDAQADAQSPVVMTDNDNDQPPCWERRPDEPSKWFDRFTVYRLLGPERSLYAAFVKYTARDGAKRREKYRGVPGSWRDNAERWDWSERAEAWDEAEHLRIEAEWEARRQELRNSEWKMSGELLDKAKQMLMFPLARTEHEQRGETTVITSIYPSRWSMGDAGRLIETASKIGRLAAEMETDRVRNMNDQELLDFISEKLSGTPDAPADPGAPPTGQR